MINYRPITARFTDYARLMRWDRPIGIWLLLWPTLWGLWLAGQGRPEGKIVTVFLLGVVVMRSLGCVANDIVDRHIDPHVERTRHRPLAAGRVTLVEAVGLLLLLAVVALGLVLLTNRLTILLAIAGFLLTLLYPLMKRITWWPQLMLALIFAVWPILMAFSALQQCIPPLAWLLALAALFWPLAYDTIYAVVDREDDATVGVKSMALYFGKMTSVVVAGFHLAMLGLLVGVGSVAHLTWPFYLGLLIAAGWVGYEQYLIKDYCRYRCFRAFRHSHFIGMSIFIGLFFHFLFYSLHK